MNELLIKSLFYADDQVILASSANEMVDIIRALKGKGMKVNVNKTKVTLFYREEPMMNGNILIDGEKVEEVKEFVYLGTKSTKDGICESDIERTMKGIWYIYHIPCIHSPLLCVLCASKRVEKYESVETE